MTEFLLYRNVDFRLSSNENVQHPDNNRYITRVWKRDVFYPPGFLEGQMAFIKAILGRPYLGSLVRTFRWTLIWPDCKAGEQTIRYEGYKAIWDAFAHLKQVVHLDLTSYHLNTKSYVRQSPSRLFSSATRIRLGGPMHRELAAAIFTNTKIESLHLFNLQDEGQDMRGRPWTFWQEDDVVESFHLFNAPEFYLDGFSFRKFDWIAPGPMRGVLPGLSASNLRELYIRRPGFICVSDDDEDFTMEQDEKSYEEYATLINTLSQTLEIFEFDQSQHQRLSFIGRSYHVPSQSARLMDDRFKRLVWPVLIAGPWPRLRRMALYGLGHWKDHPRIVNSEEIAELQNAVGRAVLEVKEKHREYVRYFYGYDNKDLWDEL